MRVVIDTNVIISRFLSPFGNPALIVALWEKGVFDLIVSEAMLDEYARVLAYPTVQARHRMSQDEIGQVISDLRGFAIVAEPSETIDIVADDPSDNRFIEAAVAGRCDYLVSGDPHLLSVGEYSGVTILSPAHSQTSSRNSEQRRVVGPKTCFELRRSVGEAGAVNEGVNLL
jgi:putative PIN family toxin of toxin-antitoxin system